MKKLNTIQDIKDLTEKLYGVDLEHFKFYDISQLNIMIDTPSGTSKVVSFVIKPGKDTLVQFEDDRIIKCSDIHLLTTNKGSLQVRDLIIGDEVMTQDGSYVKISNIGISDSISNYYDVEIDSLDHLYFTANGICHHNTGKTHTTEKVLHSMGLEDGKGYFKNTGSVSAAGLYSLLFRYKDKIVLFDDSDDVFNDTEGRNILKAATDTKKKRKLVWNKMGKNVVDPDTMTDDEILDAGLIPRYFEFTGRIIFISNMSLDKLDPDKALRTRAFIIDINPTDEEIYDFMDKIVGDMELEDGLQLTLAQRKHVVELLRKGKSKQSANLRKLSRGLAIAGGAVAAGVSIKDEDLTRLIMAYA